MSMSNRDPHLLNPHDEGGPGPAPYCSICDHHGSHTTSDHEEWVSCMEGVQEDPLQCVSMALQVLQQELFARAKSRGTDSTLYNYWIVQSMGVDKCIKAVEAVQKKFSKEEE